MTRINIDIPDDLHKKAKIICAISQNTLKDYIVTALKEKLKKEKTNI